MSSLTINTIESDSNTNFNQQPTTSDTIIAYPDVSIPTGLVSKSWVTTAFTYFLGVIHSWTDTQTFSNVITNGLILSEATNITLGNGTIAPIGGQLGVSYTGAVASGTYALAGTLLVSATISNLPAGTYMVSYVIGPNKTTTTSTIVSQVIAGFSTTSGGCDYGIFKNSLTQAASTVTGNNFFMNGTDIFTTLVTVNLYLSAGVKATAGNFIIPALGNNNKFKAVRIA